MLPFHSVSPAHNAFTGSAHCTVSLTVCWGQPVEEGRSPGLKARVPDCCPPSGTVLRFGSCTLRRVCGPATALHNPPQLCSLPHPNPLNILQSLLQPRPLQRSLWTSTALTITDGPLYILLRRSTVLLSHNPHTDPPANILTLGGGGGSQTLTGGSMLNAPPPKGFSLVAFIYGAWFLAQQYECAN